MTNTLLFFTICVSACTFITLTDGVAPNCTDGGCANVINTKCDGVSQTCVCLAGYSKNDTDTCVRVCPKGEFINGTIAYSPDPPASGSVATYSCDPGFTLDGVSTRSCSSDGAWIGTEPNCIPMCPKGEFINGTIAYSPDPPAPGSVATYSCDPGFTLDGVSTRSCSSDGAWIGTEPNCIPSATDSPTVPTDAPTVPTDAPTVLTDAPTVPTDAPTVPTDAPTVPTDIPTTTTDGPVPQCTNGCLNGGTCAFQEPTQLYECSCPPGISGDVCEVEDVCFSQPCPDAAIDCVSVNKVDQQPERVCICPENFKGPQCKEDDPPVVCRDEEHIVYMENSPSVDQRTVCLNKSNTGEADICHNPSERIVYEATRPSSISINDNTDTFCLTYSLQDQDVPPSPTLCVKVNAFEEDDLEYRRWINDTANICFIFNRRPVYTGETFFNYNIPDMNSSEEIPISAADDDTHQRLAYSIISITPKDFSEIFLLDGNRLKVTPPVNLVGDIAKTANISIEIRDNGQPSMNANAVIAIRFTNKQLSCSVSPDKFYVHNEPLPSNPVIMAQISCTGYNNTDVTVDLIGSVAPVNVTPDGVVLYNSTVTADTGEFKVTMFISVTQPLQLQTQLEFTLIAGDFTPICNTSNTPAVTFSEDETVGTCKDVVVTCTNEVRALESCTDDSTLFTIECNNESPEQTTVRVCTVASLTYSYGTYTVKWTIKNTYGESTETIDIDVTNVNDQPVILANASSEFQVEEDSLPGYLVAIISVSDPDIVYNSSVDVLSVTLSDTGNLSIPFVARLQDGQSAVNITVSGPLSVNVKQRYDIGMELSDSAGLKDSIVIAINIIDVNEVPTCESEAIEAEKSVQSEVGEVVAELKCADEDKEIGFKSLSYKLSGPSDIISYFSVNYNGTVKLVKRLISFTQPNAQLAFTVVVEDGEGLSVRVNISVTVSNSVNPLCQNPTLQITKSETLGANVSFPIITSCRDPVVNATLSYDSLTGNGTTLFRLDSDQAADNNLHLYTLISLKHKYGIWMIHVRVFSPYGERNITIQLTVLDINDPPRFNPVLYTTSIMENTTIGSLVTTVSATDPDSGVFGTVTYSSPDIGAYFSLDRTTGQIKVTAALDTDKDSPSRIIHVVATDGALETATATATVIINIQDVNDEPPVCEVETNIITVVLTAPTGTALAAVNCSDLDVSPQYKQMDYSITYTPSSSDDASEVFSITDVGLISLSGALVTSIPEYTITVFVKDRDTPQLMDTVSITVKVNSTLPPSCDRTIIETSFGESKPEGFCIADVVQCTDPIGGTMTITDSTGNGTNLLEVRSSTSKDKIVINACIKISPRGRFGEYLLVGYVSNGFATTKIYWYFSVYNVNDAPRFELPLYNISVNETLKTGNKPILTLEVSDLDTNTDNESFKITSVEATLINSADFDDQLSDPFLFISADIGFYTRGDLNATVRNLYVYSVTATDGEGLSGSTEVEIHVRDINSPPVCQTGLLEATIDILYLPGRDVFKLFCYDTDIDKSNTDLYMTITGGDKDGHFNITADGTIMVAKGFPRSALYQTRSANLTVLVRDRGVPEMSTVVFVKVNVNNKIPPTCDPFITPPDIWVYKSCATITMDCTDPTTTSNNHLTYSVSGNYTAGFNKTKDANGIIELCYNLASNGSLWFNIKVVVDNSLDKYIYRDIIVVNYLKAVPLFTQTTYRSNITENISPGTAFLTVMANSSKLVGSLVYRVIATESYKEWETYFELNSVTGVISTKAGIKSLADITVHLKTEVVDTGSLLKSSAQVSIHVLDINESPECDVTIAEVNIGVDIDVGHRVVVFNCSDRDSKPDYKSLEYSLSGDAVSTYFELDKQPESTTIFVGSALNVTTALYSLTLTVADAGSPPLTFVRTFTINVDLLPPAVIVQAVALQYNLIQVNWHYEREDFYSVTRSYTVITNGQQSTFESPDQEGASREYNETRVIQSTTYKVFVRTSTDYGTTESAVLNVLTPEKPKISYTTWTFRVMDTTWNNLLRNILSQQYFSEKEKIIRNAELVLKQIRGYIAMTLTFRPSNSILVDAYVSLNQSNTAEAVTAEFNKSLSSGWLGSMSVDPNYFIVGVDGYIVVDGISQSPSDIYNGSAATLTCNLSTVGFPKDTEFKYWWTYNGTILQPISQSRYKISPTVSSPLIEENKKSTLTIDPILDKHSGLYGCHASVADDTNSVKESISVIVKSQPIVVIKRRSLTVNAGDTVVITCEAALLPIDEFIWYRNDVILTASGGVAVSTDGIISNLSINNIQENSLFGCAGTNIAGTGPRVSSYIGVIPADPTEDKYCPENEVYNKTWPITSAKSEAIKECESGFKGSVHRMCDENGNWLNPSYDCIRKSFADIGDQVETLQDGSGSASLPDVLNDLANETTNTDLFTAELDVVINILDTAANITKERPGGYTQQEAIDETGSVIKVASNLINETHKETWIRRIEEKNEGAMDIPIVVEEYLRAIANQLDPYKNETRTFTTPNIYAEVGSGKRSGTKSPYVFPDRSNRIPDLVKESSTGISIPSASFKDKPIRYTGSFYGNMTDILLKRLKRNGVIEDISTTLDINADIISFQPYEDVGTIDPPATIIFQHHDVNYSDPICCYWNVDESVFAMDGCSRVSTNDTTTVCECNHFTNFAILMSPGRTPEAHVMALSIISAVGCAISIFCLLLTIVLYLLVWRLVKSDRAVLLMNLCIALIISYAIFLGGVDRAENKDVCTAIAILLHFFYLAVFFIMLAYGIEIAVSVIYVFVTSSRLKWLLPLAWAIPLVIVGVSAGVTQLDGYGNEEFCWLSTDSGLLWAFVGPAAFVILANFIIVIAVFRKMFASSVMLTKSDKEKAKTGVRSVCVLLPILGLTWVFGVFSVNEDMVAFQYIFAVCNSLQGFFIFLFHCVLNSQLKDALKQRKLRKKSLASFENDYKNQHSSSGTTAFYSDESQSSKPANNEPSALSNPFLEADRQMKEYVAKNKNGAHLTDNTANNKLAKSNNAIDLEDVKISNILRESEVMGGTTGISSILQTESERKPEPDTGEIRTGEDWNGARESKVSTKYDYINPSDIETNLSTTLQQQRPAGYEKLLKPNKQQKSASYDNVYTGSDRSKDRERERQREMERENEKETQRQIELMKERQKHIDKEKRDRAREQESTVIRVGYDKGDPYRSTGSKGSREKDLKSFKQSSRSSRSDDDLEARMQERQDRLTHVYTPYGQTASASAQNITSISTALPTKNEAYQGRKKQESQKRGTDTKKKDKDRGKKKSSLKDRSRAYEYSYDTTYLGDQSRHASIENMNAQYGYSPYAQMPGMGGYQSGRPAQQQHAAWDQYRYPQYQQQYRGDYW